MGSSSRSKSLCAAALFWAACTSEPTLVASNCEMGDSCLKTAALKLDAVDLLLVIDDSPSVIYKGEQLRTELPRLLEAITSGEADGVSFPPAKSVHVAVTTTDMGGANGYGPCLGPGRDGVFVRPDDLGVTCNTSYPGYLAYAADSDDSAADSTSCVPLVFPDPASAHGWWPGCGFEQPLEAALKSVWPHEDTSIMFNFGPGHGDEKNAGFLRENSVLVVVVVSDEDDCSVSDTEILALSGQSQSEYAKQPVQLRCHLNPDKLQTPKRYIDHLKALRPNNDNVVFAVIGGIPPELVSDEYRSHYDFDKPAQVDQYYADVLRADDMQEVAVNEQQESATLRPSCTRVSDGVENVAMPPRRMVEVARGFGAQGVLGSICADDFGATTGRIIHALAEKLSAAADR